MTKARSENKLQQNYWHVLIKMHISSYCHQSPLQTYRIKMKKNSIKQSQHQYKPQQAQSHQVIQYPQRYFEKAFKGKSLRDVIDQGYAPTNQFQAESVVMLQSHAIKSSRRDLSSEGFQWKKVFAMSLCKYGNVKMKNIHEIGLKFNLQPIQWIQYNNQRNKICRDIVRRIESTISSDLKQDVQYISSRQIYALQRILPKFKQHLSKQEANILINFVKHSYKIEEVTFNIHQLVSLHQKFNQIALKYQKYGDPLVVSKNNNKVKQQKIHDFQHQLNRDKKIEKQDSKFFDEYYADDQQ